MARPPSRGEDPYRISFDASAWHEVGRLSRDTFEALRQAVEAGVKEIENSPPGEHGAQTKLRITAAGLMIVYQRDDATRTLTVLEIHPAAGGT
jgi:mRNA-degrading endonuclease RelE of RelBE toxin-antitoxin system